MMKKLFSILLSFMILAFFACGKNSYKIKTGENIKIGFLGPMTGDAGHYGKLMSQAVKIAIDEFNSEGGVEGFKVELIIEDDEASKEKGIIAMKKLADVDRVYGVIGAFSSSVSLAVAPKAEASKIIMISPSSTHKNLPDKGEFIFRNIVSDALQAVISGKYLAKIDKVKTVAILYTKNDYSESLAMDFKAQYEKEGGKVIAVETALQGDKDFTKQLKRIKSGNPEALYLPDYITEIALILEQVKDLGLKTKIYTADAFSNPKIFELAGDLANGVIYTQAAEQPYTKKRKVFQAKYQAKWGVKPDVSSLDDLKKFYDGSIYWGVKPDTFSLNAYDGAKIILSAIKSVAAKGQDGVLNIDRNKVRDIVAKTKDYEGASGKVTFTPNGDLDCNIGIYTVEKRKFKQLKVFKLDGEKLVEIK